MTADTIVKSTCMTGQCYPDIGEGQENQSIFVRDSSAAASRNIFKDDLAYQDEKRQMD